MNHPAWILVSLFILAQCSNVYAETWTVVLETIRRNAANEWPDDYARQQHEIRRQLIAHDYVTHYNYIQSDYSQVPSDIIKPIMRNAANDWPNDYAMQENEIKRQLEAYRYVKNAARNPKVPYEVFTKIKRNAANAWPKDYSMQKHEIERQVKAYLGMQGR